MIEFEDFSKNYSKKSIISKSNFKLKSNNISFLMGPNGSGKTTLIKCMLGMEYYNGKIVFDGNDIDKVRDNCLVIWDDCPFYTNLSGLENLMILGEGKKSREQIKEVAVNYLDNDLLRKKVNTYSYGQKKKLALLLVEVLEPDYLFMDEISNGLDYEMMRTLTKKIKKWAEKMSILVTGHQFSFYNEIVDSLLVFKDKQIIISNENFNKSNKSLEDIYDEQTY
ncbi:ATP-binding cassette domain-containing protein [Alkaliphilus pronyensis]|uniref:ATP-binding cassette domain-containing protein n=1 Tax=Alkaliphilus pronyensis TaxID=1482732 RepID=A0A6I0F6X8_9FIRM|nr:ATP-binding cassette domain-containing protein [Alkaliphilus pronyensis]KAB3537735.1 ATP-binding cassette domain-containing protein [Alkaliphilus pronyensis]